MFGFAELAEQLAGIERWANDLRERAHRLLRDPADPHTPVQAHVIADEYAALADERDAAAAWWERAEPGGAVAEAQELRRLSSADRDRCAYYRARATQAPARWQPAAGLVPSQSPAPQPG